MVSAQVGVSTLNPKIARWLEPMATTPRRRLKNVKRLLECGIDVAVRVDPLVPYVTDTPEQMTDLCRELAGMGVRNLSAAYLFVRPRIFRNILADLPGPTWRRRLWEVYHAGVTAGLHGEGAAIRLPSAKYRAAGYDRLRVMSSRFGLHLRLCSCKNPDMDLPDKCNLVVPAGPAFTPRRQSPGDRQLALF
jgi:DNA repair photolyase